MSRGTGLAADTARVVLVSSAWTTYWNADRNVQILDDLLSEKAVVAGGTQNGRNGSRWTVEASRACSEVDGCNRRG